MRAHAFLFVFAIALMGGLPQAHASVAPDPDANPVASTACSTLGLTKMSLDNVGIFACLGAVSSPGATSCSGIAGGCVWQPMTTSSTTTVPWSAMPSGSTCGAYVSGAESGTNGLVACQGYNPASGCPPGFVRRGGDYQSPGNRFWFTCAKI